MADADALTDEAGRVAAACRVLANYGSLRSVVRGPTLGQGRRTQVAKGEVCKTSMQRFESARRLQPSYMQTG